MTRAQLEALRKLSLGCGLVLACGCASGNLGTGGGDGGRDTRRPPDTRPADVSSQDTRSPDASEPDAWAGSPRDGQTSDAPGDTQPSDTQSPDTQSPDTQPPDTQSPDTQSPDTQPPDTQPPDTQPPDTQPPDTQPPDTQPPDTGVGTTKPCQPGVGWAANLSLPAGASIDTWQPLVQPGLSTAQSAGEACTGPRTGGTAVLCVDDSNASSSQSGTAAAPYRTIQAAVDAAANGDLIQVAGGTYGENVEILDKGVRLLGGFAGASSYGGSGSGDFSTRIPATYVTTVRGQGGGSAIDILSANPAIIDGLRIIEGTGNENESRFYFLGGGICANESTVTIQHCVIEDNDIVTTHPERDMVSLGGALQGAESRVTLYANIIRNNRSGRGAIAIDGPKTVIEANMIVDNISVGDHGGGLYLSGGEVTVRDNLVARNRVEPRNGRGGWGGGIMVFNVNTQALLQGNVIAGNSAPSHGSGVFVDDAATATLINELIYANVCAELGGTAVYVDADDSNGPSTATLKNVTIAGHACSSEWGGNAVVVENSITTITNSILWANGGDNFFLVGDASLSVSHSIVGESVSGTNNQRVDPLFADPPNDFHLCSMNGRYEPRASGPVWALDTVHSPAIDSANPATSVASETQPNGACLNRGTYGGTTQASRSN